MQGQVLKTMDNAKLRNNLMAMVESELFFKVRALGEGTAIKKEDLWKVRKLVINNFFAGLPENYKNLPDCYEIIYNPLSRLEQNKKEQKER